MIKLLSAIVWLAILNISGCASESPYQHSTYEDAAKNNLIPTNYLAADALITQCKGVIIIDQPIIIATVVNIDYLERSSTLGRLISEHISARFSQSGFKMIEMKFQNSVYMKRNEGELMLTREIREIAQANSAQAVILGTFSKAANTVFINLKLVQPETNRVLAAHDYALPLDGDISRMLQGNPQK